MKDPFNEKSTPRPIIMEETLGEDFQWWWNMGKYKKKDIPAKQYSKVKIRQRMVGHKGWPGAENPVNYWVILENDKAVGFYEPSKGKAEFPVYDYKDEDETIKM
tara:strand:+ start:31251 stop:31562 length:312 start_codon:yes stop_codon:yes gene_type:complete